MFRASLKKICSSKKHFVQNSLCRRATLTQSLLIRKTCAHMPRKHPPDTQPNGLRWLCNPVQATTNLEWGCFITGINTVSFHYHSSQLRSISSEEQPITKTNPLSDQSQFRTEILKFSDSDIFVFDQWPEPELFKLPNLKNFSHSNHSKCSFQNFGEISDFLLEFFGPNFSGFRANPGSDFRVTSKCFSGIRRAVGRTVVAFFGMESGDRCFFKICCCRAQFKGHFSRC